MLEPTIKKRTVRLYSGNMIFSFYLVFLFLTPTIAQDYDILIKGGHVMDAKNEINSIMDIAILNGKIAMIAAHIPEKQAKAIIVAKGLIVTPGLIDIHGHIFFGTQSDSYLSNGYSSLPPDGFTFRSGVTTIVDAGGEVQVGEISRFLKNKPLIDLKPGFYPF